MKQYDIGISYHFPQPVDRLFSWFSDHENLSLIFAPFKVSLLSEGVRSRNGTGSVRQLSCWPIPPIEETIVGYAENDRIEYKITAGKVPITKHRGTVVFCGNGASTQIHYSVNFYCKYPLIGHLLRLNIERNLKKGFRKLAKMSI